MKVTLTFDSDNHSELMEARHVVMVLLNDELPDTSLDVTGQITGHDNSPPPTDIPSVVNIPPTLVSPPTEVPEGALPLTDKSGIPWDTRIHSAGKSITGKGLWKRKRSVDEALVKQVEAELLGATAIAPAEIPSLVPPAVAVAPLHPDAPAPVPVAPAPVAPAPVAPAPVAIEPGQPVPPAEEALTWAVMLRKISTAQSGGTFNQERMDQLLSHYQITGGMPMLATRSDLYQSLVDDISLGL